MTFIDNSLLGLAPAGMPRRQYPVMIVEWGQAETELEPRSGQNLLERRNARLTAPALDPGYLGLRYSGALGQLSLGQAGLQPGQLQEGTCRHRGRLRHIAMIADQLLGSYRRAVAVLGEEDQTASVHQASRSSDGVLVSPASACGPWLNKLSSSLASKAEGSVVRKKSFRISTKRAGSSTWG
jgi:hypothetical protein